MAADKTTKKQNKKNSLTGTASHQAQNTNRRRLNATRMEEIRWDPDSVFKENPYYIRIANRYRIAKYITIVLTLIFAVTMMTVFSEDITAENFQYFIKDLDLSGLSSDETFDTLLYNGGSDSSFGLYRGELIIVSAGSISLYKPSGALSMNKTNIYYSPMLLTSDKYFLVYDRGETSRSYSVLNSFAELKTETLDYPITSAALSDNGAYALVTRDDSFRGIVRFYDRDFRLKMEIKKDKYILSVAISDDGQTLGMASVYDKDGDFVTEIMTVRAGSSEPEITISEVGLMPLKIQIMADGSIGVLYTDRTILYNADGSERVTYSYASMPSVRAALGDSFVCMVYNTTVIGNDKTITISDLDGQMIFDYQLSGELIRIIPHGELLCLLFEDRAILLDPFKNTILETPLEPNAIDIVFAENTPIVCYSGNAVALSFYDGSETIGEN